MAHLYGVEHSVLFSGTDFGQRTATIQHMGNVNSADLDARVGNLVFRNEPEDYGRVTMHELLSFFGPVEARSSGDMSANATKASSLPSSVSITEDTRWKSIEEYTDTFRNVPPVVLRGVLACIGVPTEKFLSCSTSGQLVDALFSELITRAFPNLNIEGVPRDVEQDLLKIKNFVWMYEMSGTKISVPGTTPNAVKIPDAHVVTVAAAGTVADKLGSNCIESTNVINDELKQTNSTKLLRYERFTIISKAVHSLNMKEIHSIAQSLRCVAIGQDRSQLANELLVNLGYQAMHSGNDLASAMQAVQVYRVAPATNGHDILKA